MRWLWCVCWMILAVSCRGMSVGAEGEGSGGEDIGVVDVTGATVRVMNWNLQTFFDGVCDGNEYEQFRGTKSTWSQEKYNQRLERLTQVIKAIDADILIFEEIEKKEQLYDIANRLTGTFNFGKLYPYGVFISTTSSSIGCGVLSRKRIISCSVHALDVRSGAAQPSMRPLLELSVAEENHVLHLFVNHWKSKLGGESEVWRRYQESVLACRVESLVRAGEGVLCAGDFNADIGEFMKLSGKEQCGLYEANVALRKGTGFAVGGKSEEIVKVYSPWLGEDGSVLSGGSYWYEGKWEKIDHFFLGGRVKLLSFRADSGGPWADSEGKPFSYKVWNGSGYSDHLPVVCEVLF